MIWPGLLLASANSSLADATGSLFDVVTSSGARPMKATGVKSFTVSNGMVFLTAGLTVKVGDTKQQRVAIRRRLGHGTDADQGAAAAAVFDHDRLPPRFRKLLADGAADQVVRAAGRERNDQGDLPGRIGLRARRGTCEDKRSSQQYSSPDHDKRLPAPDVIPSAHAKMTYNRPARD